MLPKPLHAVLVALAERDVDVTIGPAGETLRLQPVDHLDDRLRAQVRAWKPQLLDLLSVQRLDVAGRAAVMRRIRYHVLVPGLPYRRGRCFSCWAALPPATIYGRCPMCAEAVRQAWMTPELPHEHLGLGGQEAR